MHDFVSTIPKAPCCMMSPLPAPVTPRKGRDCRILPRVPRPAMPETGAEGERERPTAFHKASNVPSAMC